MTDANVEMEVEVESASAGPSVEQARVSSPLNTSQEANKNVVVTTATAGSVTVSLHPLVIMNVSEHWTRLRAQEGSPQTVIGAIIGKQKGRNIEVMNSFELVFNIIENDLIIDRDYYNAKEEQFKQVFSEMDFLGWYTTGEAPTERDIAIHRQICEINECPVMLQLNPYGRSADTHFPKNYQKELPVGVYESVIDLVGGRATMLLAPLPYTLAAEEAERIGVDHVARVSGTDQQDSSLVAEHLLALRSAIRMLVWRVRVVGAVVRGLSSGELPSGGGSVALLREARALVHRLPLMTTQLFRTDFYNQSNDVALMTYLGTVTKGCNDLNQFMNKFNLLYDKHTMTRKMRGLFF